MSDPVEVLEALRGALAARAIGREESRARLTTFRAAFDALVGDERFDAAEYLLASCEDNGKRASRGITIRSAVLRVLRSTDAPLTTGDVLRSIQSTMRADAKANTVGGEVNRLKALGQIVEVDRATPKKWPRYRPAR